MKEHAWEEKMRALTLIGIVVATGALVACQAKNPPRSAGIPAPAIVQDAQSAPSAGPGVAMGVPSVAELSPSAGSPASLNANGPPLNILKPPR
jgi:hypothetical protein